MPIVHPLDHAVQSWLPGFLQQRNQDSTFQPTTLSATNIGIATPEPKALSPSFNCKNDIVCIKLLGRSVPANHVLLVSMRRSSKQWQEKALAVSIIAGSNYLSIISQPNDVEVPGRDRRVPASISVWMNWSSRVFVQVWFLHSIRCAASGCSLIVGQSAHAPHCLLSSVEMSGEPPENPRSSHHEWCR